MEMEEFTTRIIQALQALESAFRRADPTKLSKIRESLLVHEEPLRTGRENFSRIDGENLLKTHTILVLAADLALEAIGLFGLGDDLSQAFMNVLKAHRKSGKAQEALFPLRNEVAQVDSYFLEPDAEHSFEGREDREGLTGIFHVETEGKPRGGYSLYVPETYDSGCARPLVVALHGGYSHGRDFIWTWLREARTRGFILLAPTSVDRTWSLMNIGRDADPLREHLNDVQSRYNIDTSHILITGMSDGATFALGMGLQDSSPFSAIAPVSGVLAATDLSYAKGRRIYWVHGALDWMFPAGRAVQAYRMLKNAGAEVELKIIEDLSHTYPREENNSILNWFTPDLK